MCCRSLTLPISSGDTTNTSPKVRGSMKRRSPPCWNVAITCGSCTSAKRPFPRWKRPLIPKCTTHTSAPSRCSRTYLPRRSTFVILCPATRDVNSLRVLCLRIARIAFFVPLTSTVLIFLPTTSRSRSRRITSTSGSSISPSSGCLPGAALVQTLVGFARGVLLGFLLRATDTGAEHLAGDRHGGGELLQVIGALLGDVVGGQRTQLLRCELLQDRLEIPIALAAHVRLHARAEQPLDQLARPREPLIQVHGAEHRLQRVGQDARLVAAARLLLPLAEQDQAAELETPGDISERLHVHDRGTQLREMPLGHVGKGQVG